MRLGRTSRDQQLRVPAKQCATPKLSPLAITHDIESLPGRVRAVEAARDTCGWFFPFSASTDSA